jgi:hypothetical protein
MSRKSRYLRIAWSVLCGILCFLVIALWVRSCWRTDILTMPRGAARVMLISCPGAIEFQSLPWRTKLNLTSFPRGRANTDIFWRWYWGPRLTLVRVPYWPIALFTAMTGAAPWLRWRFSLRTLLIGMTVVAILLGTLSFG